MPPRRIHFSLAIAFTIIVGATAPPHNASAQPTCDGTTGWLVGDDPDGSPPATRSLDTWLAQLSPTARDEILLDEAEIEALNERNADTTGAWRDPFMARQPSPDAVESELLERLNEIGQRVATGEYVEDAPGAFDGVRRTMAAAYPVDEIRAVAEIADLRCIPLASGLYRKSIDKLFDRNQCSRLHPGEYVRVLRRTPDDRWVYVRAGHGVGWLDPFTLTPPMSADQARALRDERARVTVLDDWIPAWKADGSLFFLRFGTAFPVVGPYQPTPDSAASGWHILVPSGSGWDDAFVASPLGLHEGYLSLTRRHFFALLFARLNDPYGWGGTGSGRDCSGLLLDAAAVSDLRLGRNSAVQGMAGWTRVDVAGRSDADKQAAIRVAAAQGIVFLYMPGHIMVYLGELHGKPYAISAISEYLMPCGAAAPGGVRTVRLDRVAVTDLERGRGTPRTSFLERITALSIFGH